MPPPRGTHNIIEGPGDYDVTSVVHNDTYPEIDPTKADMAGKVVFITGASRGLGRAMVLSFVKAGVSGIALKKDIASTAAAVGTNAPQFLPISLDVTDERSVNDAAAKVEKELGTVDILINNAGIMGNYANIGESDPTAWWDVHNVNLRGAYLVTRAFLPLLLKGNDDIKYAINVTSVASHLYNPTMSAYEISKLSLWKLSQLVNVEYGAQGLTSFSIHPGNVPTDIIGGPDALPDHHKPVFVETPELGADSIVFLTSKKRAWLGGRYINLTWDLPELMSKEDEIVAGNKLKNKFDF